MIAQYLYFLLILGAALAYKPFEDVDPNTLSCDPEGQEFLLLPDYEECDKFFSCANGVEVLFHCAAGTVFDFELQGCNWEWDTKCILRSKEEVNPDEEEEEGSGNASFEEVYVPRTPLLGPLVDLKDDAQSLNSVRQASLGQSIKYGNIINCRLASSATKQIAYRGDCQRYWRCVDGVPQTMICSEGLFFNERTQQCDHEVNVTCDVQTTDGDDELKGEFMVYK